MRDTPKYHKIRFFQQLEALFQEFGVRNLDVCAGKIGLNFQDSKEITYELRYDIDHENAPLNYDSTDNWRRFLFVTKHEPIEFDFKKGKEDEQETEG